MSFLTIYYYLQVVSTTMAVSLNVFLVYLVVHFSNRHMGNYRILIIAFAIFESIYAIAVFAGMPMPFIADKSWLIFTHSEILLKTSFASIGPGLYCTFYEIWEGFVVFHFIYRPELASKISDFFWPKLIIFFVWTLFLFCTFLCGIYFCTRLPISQKLDDLVHKEFGLEETEKIGYILMRKRDPTDDSISFAGTMTLTNHFILVISSAAIILFCGIRIWQTIIKMKEDTYFLKDHKVQKQMFVTLVIQTLVPVIFCHTPTLIYLIIPFCEVDISFGQWSLIFSMLTSISKWIDPIIVIFFIKEYRKAILHFLTGRRKVQSIQGSSQDHQGLQHFSNLRGRSDSLPQHHC